MKGSRNLLKLTPLLKMAITSERAAILEVKNITAIKIKSGKSIASIRGIKPK
jgi:hypothetical protein